MSGPRLQLVLLTSLCLASPALAQPRPVIIMGGGWGPEGTQASIEAHVIDLQAGLPAGTPVHFAAGSGPLPAVQTQGTGTDEVAAILGLAFDRLDNLSVDYRATQISGAGPGSKQAFLQSLKAAEAEGQTVVFAAGHGAPESDDQPAALELWGPEDRLSVPDLAQALDRSSRTHSVAFVLGHCHSGAFAEVMFVGADPQAGLAQPTRCVLAAVPADREAAGCTPDVNDPGAQAYMAAIAQALSHRAEADFDRDGQLSLAEADAWARIHDRTVDVPVKTSEVWLDLQLSNLAPDLTRWSRQDLLRLASVTERAVLEQTLPKPWSKAEPTAVAQAHGELSELIKVLDEVVQGILQRREVCRRGLLDGLLLRWPQLANPYHARARQLLAGDAVQVINYLKGRPQLEQIRSLDASMRALDDRVLALQRQAARIERWLRTAQGVANRAALRESKDASLQATLTALQACEALPVPAR